jgi:hypothetical protein
MIDPASWEQEAECRLSSELPWERSPDRLWSLWEMIKVALAEYLNIGMHIQNSRHAYMLDEAVKGAGIVGTIIESVTLNQDQKKDVGDTLVALRKICKNLNLVTSYNLLVSLDNQIPETSREYNVYIQAIYAELKSKLFLHVPSSRSKWYEWDDILSDETKTAFPSAYNEIREAGNCFATARYTASVFHSMRAAEIGLRSLGKALNIEFPFPIELADWQNIIEKVEVEIKKMSQLPKSTQRDKDQQFYSEAAVHFRYFKDAWRIRVSHVRETYDEAQAYGVLNHACEFSDVLAARLSE